MPRVGNSVRVGALVVSLIVAGCVAEPADSPPLSSVSPAAASDAASVEPSEAATPSVPSPATDGPTAGTTRTDDHGIEQVWVPAGIFLMGTDETDPAGVLAPPDWARFELAAERPQHEVSLSKGYWIDKTEVSNAAYQAFVDDGGYATATIWSEEGAAWLADQDVAELPSTCGEPGADHPRVCITWFEAEAYAAWRGGALPTEAQWEFAARGPKSSVFPWGDDWDPAKANVVDSTTTTPVGSLPAGASWVGALDMSGNAMEWVQDWYTGTYYQQRVRDDPPGSPLGSKKVEKGGWWGAVPYVARAAYRHFEDPPTYQDHHIGVRIVSPG